MIRLKSVKLCDGTVYHNLYFDTDFDDLEDQIYCRKSPIYFYEKHGDKIIPVAYDIRNIKDIEKDDTFDESMLDYVLVTDDTNKKNAVITMMYDPVANDEEFDEDDDAIRIFMGDPKLERSYNFFMEYFPSCLEEYDELSKKDAKLIESNMINACCGYIESSIDLDDPNTKEENVTAQGYVVGIMMAVYTLLLLEKDINDKMVRGDILEFTKKFSEFMDESDRTVEEIANTEDATRAKEKGFVMKIRLKPEKDEAEEKKK